MAGGTQSAAAAQLFVISWMEALGAFPSARTMR